MGQSRQVKGTSRAQSNRERNTPSPKQQLVSAVSFSGSKQNQRASPPRVVTPTRKTASPTQAYAGARFSEPPSPCLLPKPPTSWVGFSTISTDVVTEAYSVFPEMTSHLKLMLKVSAWFYTRERSDKSDKFTGFVTSMWCIIPTAIDYPIALGNLYNECWPKRFSYHFVMSVL